MAAVNRGANATVVGLNWTMLEMSTVTAASTFDVRDLWAKKPVFRAQKAGFEVTVPSHDIMIYRLTASK